MIARLTPDPGDKRGLRAHVLVIEPDGDVAQLVTLLLETEGYRTTWARSGSIGLMLLRATLHPLVVWIGERPGDMTLEELFAAVAADLSLAIHAPVLFTHDRDGLANLCAQYPSLTQRVVQLPVSSDDMLASIADAAAAIGGQHP